MPCDLARRIAWRRPASLRERLEASPVYATKFLRDTASKEVAEINRRSLIASGVQFFDVKPPPADELADAFRRHQTKHEQINERIHDALAQTSAQRRVDIAVALRGDIIPSQLTMTRIAA